MFEWRISIIHHLSNFYPLRVQFKLTTSIVRFSHLPLKFFLRIENLPFILFCFPKNAPKNEKQVPKNENHLPKQILGNYHFKDKSGNSIDFTAFFKSFPNSSHFPKNTVFQNLYVIGQASVSFFEALKFEFCIFENDNKILVLLSKMRDLQGFWRKKRPCKIALARSIFLLWFYNLGLPQIKQISSSACP